MPVRGHNPYGIGQASHQVIAVGRRAALPTTWMDHKGSQPEWVRRFTSHAWSQEPVPLCQPAPGQPPPTLTDGSNSSSWNFDGFFDTKGALGEGFSHRKCLSMSINSSREGAKQSLGRPEPDRWRAAMVPTGQSFMPFSRAVLASWEVLRPGLPCLGRTEGFVR